MRWAKSVRYQANVVYEGIVYNIRCDSDFDEDLTLSIDGEYICDVDKLPSFEDVKDYIDQKITLEAMTLVKFPGERDYI